MMIAVAEAAYEPTLHTAQGRIALNPASAELQQQQTTHLFGLLPSCGCIWLELLRCSCKRLQLTGCQRTYGKKHSTVMEHRHKTANKLTLCLQNETFCGQYVSQPESIVAVALSL